MHGSLRVQAGGQSSGVKVVRACTDPQSALSSSPGRRRNTPRCGVRRNNVQRARQQPAAQHDRCADEEQSLPSQCLHHRAAQQRAQAGADAAVNAAEQTLCSRVPATAACIP